MGNTKVSLLTKLLYHDISTASGIAPLRMWWQLPNMYQQNEEGSLQGRAGQGWQRVSLEAPQGPQTWKPSLNAEARALPTCPGKTRIHHLEGKIIWTFPASQPVTRKAWWWVPRQPLPQERGARRTVGRALQMAAELLQLLPALGQRAGGGKASNLSPTEGSKTTLLPHEGHFHLPCLYSYPNLTASPPAGWVAVSNLPRILLHATSSHLLLPLSRGTGYISAGTGSGFASQNFGSTSFLYLMMIMIFSFSAPAFCQLYALSAGHQPVVSYPAWASWCSAQFGAFLENASHSKESWNIPLRYLPGPFSICTLLNQINYLLRGSPELIIDTNRPASFNPCNIRLVSHQDNNPICKSATFIR